MRVFVLLLLIPMAVILAGCGSKSGKVASYPVSGQINYAGRPAAGVHVFFLPTSAPTVPDIPGNPHGITGADGRFTLSTFKDGDGAPEGGYQIILFWPEETKEDEEESEEDRLLGWYSGVQSKLTAEIKPGDNTLPTFDLPARKAPPPKSEGVPGRN